MSGDAPACPLLAESVAAFRDATARAAALRQRLTPRQLAWTPDERTWSVLECVRHLSITAEKQLGRLRVSVLEGRSRGLTGGAPPYGKGTWAGRFLLRGMESGRRFRTFRSFDPVRETLDADRVFEEFRETNQELVRLAMEADGLDLGRIKVGSAPTNLLKMTLAQAFRMHALHHARHLDQAEALLDLDDFPR